MHPLERITHIASIAVAILSPGLLVERRFHPTPGKSTALDRNVDEGTLIGKRLELPGSAPTWSKKNVVLFLNSHCGYCIQSLPFTER
jgi:hypothetical protein